MTRRTPAPGAMQSRVDTGCSRYDPARARSGAMQSRVHTGCSRHDPAPARSGAMQSRVHTGCSRHDPARAPLRCHAVTCTHGMFSP